MKKFILILLMSLVMVNFVNAALIQYSDYEVEKLSEIISNDCDYNTWFVICQDTSSEIKTSCLYWKDHGIPVSLLERGDIQRYRGDDLIDVNKEIKKVVGDEYLLRIINSSKEDVKEYLSARNAGLIIGPMYLGYPYIICESRENRSDYITLTANEYNQKYWGDELIKEPRAFLSIGNFSFSIFGGVSVISVFSISLITIVVFICRKIPSKKKKK